MNKALLALFFLFFLSLSWANDVVLNDEPEEVEPEEVEPVEEGEDPEGEIESYRGKIFGEDLLDQGELCWITEAEGEEFYDCTYHCFYNADHWDEIFDTELEWQCALATTNCAATDKFDEYNFFLIAYCWFGGNIYIFIPLSFLAILFVFMQAKQIVEESLAPAMAYLANDFFKMPQTLAGVTFIAVANGCNDVIVALIASESAGGVSYNVGALFGSGMFVASIVICIVIFKAPSDNFLRVDPTLVQRDLLFYIFSSFVVFVFGFFGYIYTWSALTMLGIYVVLIVVVVCQDSGKKNADELLEEDQDYEDEDNKEYKIDYKLFDLKTAKGRLKLALFKMVYHSEFSTLPTAQKKKLFALREKTRDLNNKNNIELQNAGNFSKTGTFDDDEEQEGILDKIFNVVDWPCKIIRRATILPCNHEEIFEKQWCYVWGIPGLALFWYLFKQSWIDFLYFGVPAGVIISALFTIFLWNHDYHDEENLPKPCCYPINAILGAISALGWNFIISTCLVDILNSYLVILKLDQTFLGLTVLGLGNSLDDALVTITYANDPKNAKMGITAGYNGQLFGLLVGFGVAQLKATLTHGPQDFEIFTQPAKYCLDTVVILLFIFVLIYTIISLKSNNLYLSKSLGKFLGSMYALMCVIAVSVQIWFIVTDANLSSPE